MHAQYGVLVEEDFVLDVHLLPLGWNGWLPAMYFAYVFIHRSGLCKTLSAVLTHSLWLGFRQLKVDNTLVFVQGVSAFEHFVTLHTCERTCHNLVVVGNMHVHRSHVTAEVGLTIKLPTAKLALVCFNLVVNRLDVLL